MTPVDHRQRWTRTAAALVASLALSLGAAMPALADDEVSPEPAAAATPAETPPVEHASSPASEPAPVEPPPLAEPSPSASPEPSEPQPGSAPDPSPGQGDGTSSTPDQPLESVPPAPAPELAAVTAFDLEPTADEVPATRYPALAHPSGQSDQPAPPSREKRVLENVHTDAVSAFVDDGVLVAQTKADIDIDGNGTVDLGSRLNAAEVLFHVGEAARLQVPAVAGFEFLGAPGDTIWLAPMVQSPEIIWPGFSTEDPNLRKSASSLDVRLQGVVGPGRVEVFMGADNRIFSSTTELPAWRIGVPQHTHMNWAFTQPGSYTLTFELSGQVDGRPQSARNHYTFVVGDLAAHTRQPSVTLAASASNLGQSEPVRLTATLAPADAVGAVEFWDLSSGALLGHTPVADGQAQFVADALNPGTRRIVANFVPTWSNEFRPASAAVDLTVAGDVQQRPDHTDTQPVPDSQVNAQQPGVVVEVTSTGKQAVTGTAVTARVKDPAFAGRWLSAWLPGQSPPWRGWVQADQHGAFSLELSGAAVRSQQLVVKDDEGVFVGWDRFAVVAPPSTGGTAGNGTGSGTGDGTGSGDPGTDETPRAPGGQTCRPPVTLDRGHIDAFYVSAANGKAVLQLMEDVTGYHVIREAETVLLKVKEAALGTVKGAPKGTPSKGYVLPLTQRSDLIWPGWDTNRTSSSGYTDVSIKVTGVKGPGTVSIYTQGDWGSWAPLLSGKRYKLPGTIREARPVHTHAQWVFSEKGIYKLTVHAVATNPVTGGSIRTASHVYVFQVGDVPLGDAFCGQKAHGAAAAKQVNAAVNKATADALEKARAAEQQADAPTATPTPGTPSPGATPPGSGPAQPGGSGGPPPSGAPTSSTGQAEGNQLLAAGLIGMGSGLLIAGIAGGTVWYVRRLRRAVPDPAG